MLAASLLLAAGVSQTASAVAGHATASVKRAYPADPNFQAGLANGQERGRSFGKGNPQVQVEYDEAVQYEQEASAGGDTEGANYWWGYRVGLGQYR